MEKRKEAKRKEEKENGNGKVFYRVCSDCGILTTRSLGTSHHCRAVKRSGGIRNRTKADRQWSKVLKKAADQHNKFRTQTVVVHAEDVFAFVRKQRNTPRLTVEIPKLSEIFTLFLQKRI